MWYYDDEEMQIICKLTKIFFMILTGVFMTGGIMLLTYTTELYPVIFGWIMFVLSLVNGFVTNAIMNFEDEVF